ncbi:hypothetical protein PV664_36635 [Streptomyces sp. ME01-18a]|uniref:hypothetical protein n=1 Tax=Streptomyces sp. ME01-18a TaxID=3028669 RepID=UPI0029BD1578|nr:hypothetical protein [Streptomyces sp. ME01-18a]MDX3434359.1 hypothetical protein [Streptomyces sp. ME01-18a]
MGQEGPGKLIALADAVGAAFGGFGDIPDFLHGLEVRGLAYALQVKGEISAHAETAEPYEPP